MRDRWLKRAQSCSIRMLGNGRVIGIAATPRSPRSRPRFEPSRPAAQKSQRVVNQFHDLGCYVEVGRRIGGKMDRFKLAWEPAHTRGLTWHQTFPERSGCLSVSPEM